jgi:hypothetical protein
MAPIGTPGYLRYVSNSRSPEALGTEVGCQTDHLDSRYQNVKNRGIQVQILTSREVQNGHIIARIVLGPERRGSSVDFHLISLSRHIPFTAYCSTNILPLRYTRGALVSFIRGKGTINRWISVSKSGIKRDRAELLTVSPRSPSS